MNTVTFDSINAERERRGIRRITIPEYESGRARYSRMAQPVDTLYAFMMTYALTSAMTADQSAGFIRDDGPYTGVDGGE